MTLDKVKVLLVTNKLGLGGTEKTLQLLATHLNKDIFRVSVCGLMGAGERGGLLRSLGYDVAIAENSAQWLVEYLKNWKFDLVHWHCSGSPEPLLPGALKSSGADSVFIRTNVFGQHDAFLPPWALDANIFVSKMCFLRYLNFQRCGIEKCYQHIKVIYNPIDLSVAHEAELSADEVRLRRAEHGIQEGEFVVGRIGRPDDSKFGNICIEMMPYLLKLQPRVKFLVVGITDKKIKRIKELGLSKHFVICEPTADSRKIHAFYYLMDVYTHSATWGESFGCSIAEAMACGRPVVCHSTPHWDNAQIELIDHGRTGFIANTPRLYAEAVDFLLRNPSEAKKMGLLGREKAESLYDIGLVARQTERLYLEMILGRGIGLSNRITDYFNSGTQSYVALQELKAFVGEYGGRLSESFGVMNVREKADYFSGEVLFHVKSLARRFWPC